MRLFHLFCLCFVPPIRFRDHEGVGGECSIPKLQKEENNDTIDFVTLFEKKRLLDYLTDEKIGIVDKVNTLQIPSPSVYLGSVLNGGLLLPFQDENEDESWPSILPKKNTK